MISTIIGRQPIYTRQFNIFAYELLFRNSVENRAIFADGDEATAQVVWHACVDIGLDALVGKKLAFINVTRNFILNAPIALLPTERIVMEVLEDVEIDARILDAVRHLSTQGYTIALDDFIYYDHMYDPVQRLVELADIIKIDVQTLDHATLQRYVAWLRCYDVKLLAEKVETATELAYCQGLGFDYFQGYFFGPPHMMTGTMRMR